ncbi:MAG: hypothetical protein GY730_06130 [bacterium]|nr:hypothetical protein [bacterium]
MVEITVPDDAVEIKNAQIDKIPSGGILYCSQCNTPLTEGLIKKGKVDVYVVDTEIEKIKLAKDIFNKHKDKVYFILRDKKECLRLQAVIGDYPNYCTIRFIEEYKKDFVFPYFYCTKLLPQNYFITDR